MSIALFFSFQIYYYLILQWAAVFFRPVYFTLLFSLQTMTEYAAFVVVVLVVVAVVFFQFLLLGIDYDAASLSSCQRCSPLSALSQADTVFSGV